MNQASVSTEPGLEIGPVNCGKLLNCNEFMKYEVQIVNKERRSFKKINKKLLLLLLLCAHTSSSELLFRIGPSKVPCVIEELVVNGLVLPKGVPVFKP